jgi:hypothetical protein
MIPESRVSGEMQKPFGILDTRWFMSPVHMSPEEAVKAHEILGAKSASPSTTEHSNWPTTALTHQRNSSLRVEAMTRS